jgi:enoyl-[acyl-carrier protein] reductase III
MIDLHGQTALVTGASRGIGRACALRLAEAGADVVVNYVSSQTAAKETAEQVQSLGRRAAIVKADVSESEDVAAMLEFVREKFGRLDVLVSNAATGGFRPVIESTPVHFEATMNANVRATLALAQAALPMLKRTEGRAKLIAMSSHGSHLALPHYGLIGASKAALEALVRHLALELGPLGVNCNVVLAGLIETDSTRRVPNSAQIFAGAQAKRMTGSRTLTAADVADVVLFLASPLSDLIQGQTITVDGGEALTP